jgi:hypothetical protein
MIRQTLQRPINTGNQVAEFFGKISQIRDIAHVTHLRQPDKKLSTHLALKTVYKKMPELVDQVIESYQGVYGLVDYTIPESKATIDPVNFIQENYDYISYNRYIFNDTWLQNMIDEIAALLA